MRTQIGIRQAVALGVAALGGFVLTGCADPPARREAAQSGFVLAGSADAPPRAHMSPGVRVGQATPETATGLQPGEAAPDFTFTDTNGHVKRLSEVRGEVTVVMFPNRPGEWLNPAGYRGLARLDQKLEQDTYGVSVVLVDVGRPHRTEEQAEETLDAAPVRSHGLVMIADPEGEIRALYGPRAGGHYFVLDQYGQIAAIGSFEAPESMRASVDRVARQIADQRPFQNG